MTQARVSLQNLSLKMSGCYRSELCSRLSVAIALHICDPAPGSKEYIDAQQAIDRAMIAFLWHAVEVDEYDLGEDYGQIDLRLDGSAEWYFRRKQAPAFKTRA